MQHNLKNWHVLADRFIWYDFTSLSDISPDVTNEEIQRYLYTFHGESLSLEEIQEWRTKKFQNDISS
jgi:hypothetical protein